uniref:COMM domain-containing protein n=1 Tax=Steinernema glaseri TaxID=37863 RepID=A0A1I8A4F3_9BILA
MLLIFERVRPTENALGNLHPIAPFGASGRKGIDLYRSVRSLLPRPPTASECQVEIWTQSGDQSSSVSMGFSQEIVAVLTALGRKKLALLSKRIFQRIATKTPDSQLFSDDERSKLVASFGVSSLDEVDQVVTSLDSFWREAVERHTSEEEIVSRLQESDFDEETTATLVQIWRELGSAVLAQKPIPPKKPVSVPNRVPDLLDVDYSVGVVVASKRADESLPTPVMQMELTTSDGPLDVELNFDQLAALHYALRDVQVSLDSS